ncbi:hypothetical protein D1871_17600 [Nakamurella silvestris]|nr:hypothetical protein D1871_17600 [Nakamurella silvestris]
MAFKRSAALLALLAFVVVGCSSDPESAPTTDASATSPVGTVDASAVQTTSDDAAPTESVVTAQLGGSQAAEAPGTTGTIPAIVPTFDPPANPGGLSNEEVAFVCDEPKTVFGDLDRKLSTLGADITVEDLQALSDSLGAIDVKKVKSLSTLWTNMHSTIADYKAATQTSSPKTADVQARVEKADADLLEFFATNCPNPR